MDGRQLLTLTAVPDTSETDLGGPDLMYLDPSAPFMSSLNLAFFGGLLLASPFVLYFIGQFVMPALKNSARRSIFSRRLELGWVCFSPE